MTEFTVITQGFVNLTIIYETNQYGIEKRFAKDVLIVDLKNKLEMMTGLVANDMKLKILDKEKKFICNLDDDNKMLGYYPADDGCFLNVEASQAVQTCADDPNFKRFELTTDEYAKKRGTVREFLEKNKLAHFSEKGQEIQKKKEEELKEKIEAEKNLIKNMPLNSRCQVTVTGHMPRLGTIMYVGEMGSKPGYWIGIKYDEPLGKNDGSVDGKRYFECLPKYGGFVKPENVVVGDFPEENFDDEL